MSEHRLSEIVIERPRGGMRSSSTKLKGEQKKLYQLTVVASEEGLLSPYQIKVRNGTKYFSDHLGPLRRLLRSKVGQPWDQVYSELCQRLNTQTLTGQHVLTHIWDYVERYVDLVDGVPYHRPGRRYWHSPLVSGYRDQFYIHPETGLLCLAPKLPKSQPKQQQQVDQLGIDA